MPAPPEVAVISTPEEFRDTNWNKPETRVYCLQPGNYTGLGPLLLTQSGTPNEQRVLRYFDPADPDARSTPAPLQRADAKIEGFEIKASFWTLDGITVERRPVPDDCDLRCGSLGVCEELCRARCSAGPCQGSVRHVKTSIAGSHNVLNHLHIVRGGNLRIEQGRRTTTSSSAP